MRRTDRLLAPDERVQLVSREHGVVLARPFLVGSGLVAAAAGTAYAAAATAAPGLLREGAGAVAAMVAVAAIARLAAAVVRWQASTLIVTDRRVMLVRGALSPRVASVRLDTIEDVEIRCSPTGRLLHYGGLVVSAGGRRGALLGLRRLPDPDLLMALLLGLTAAPVRRRTRGRGGMAAAPTA